MTVSQTLHGIQRITGLSQAALAQKFGVTFAAFNRWMNNRAVPHPAMRERINRFYRELSELSDMPGDALEGKKKILAIKARKSRGLLQKIMSAPDIRDQFLLVLTYTSNSIEGSTLTEAETAVVLFQNATLRNKTLTEQLEAKNHQTALMHLLRHLQRRRPVNEDLILRLHEILMNGIRDDAGCYRSHGVRIVGSDIATANYLKVPVLMAALMKDVTRSVKDIVAHATAIHARFEHIHPFSDGNGRIGRLLLHAMLLRKNLPPVVVQPAQKSVYYAFLNRAQKTGDTAALEDFLCDGVFEGWGVMTTGKAGSLGKAPRRG